MNQRIIWGQKKFKRGCKMPNSLSNENRGVLDALLNSYNALPWYKKLFYPGALSEALTRSYASNPSCDSALAVCEAYLNKTWFFQRWFFSSLSAFSSSNLGRALGIINEYGLFTGEAAQENFNAIAGHQDPRCVAWALRELNEAGLLTGEAAQANRNALVQHEFPDGVASALENLNKAGLLTGEAAQANRDALVGHQKPRYVAWALRELNEANLLTGGAAQANFNALVGYQDPHYVIHALKELNEANLLTGEAAQANRGAIVQHQNPLAVVCALIVLNEANLLTGETAQANRDALVGHQNQDYVIHALRGLNAAHLLTQGVFDSIAITHRDILCHIDTGAVWDRIPSHELTQARLDAIIAICNNNQDNPNAARRLFINYVNQEILGIEAGHAPAAAVFNLQQSTHTASVHQSVSASAKNLNTLYSGQIDSGEKLNNVITEISAWLNTATADEFSNLPPAQRCFSRITAENYYHRDETSKVSIKQLLALAWLAIHDGERRICSLEDAKPLFIEGLYEIQRGYNKNAGNDDLSICAAGTFNKIVEKLAGIHPAVEVLFITQAGASAKLPIVVNEAAINFVRRARTEEQKRAGRENNSSHSKSFGRAHLGVNQG